MGIFEKYLSAWVILCIALGVLLGYIFPRFFQIIAMLEYSNVNFIIAILLWGMIYPMMLQINFNCIKNAKKESSLGLALTLIVNWLIKPFTMAGLAWLFFIIFFKDLVNPADAKEYIAGMILLGVAPCTAMVFVWSNLTKGNATYTLIQVAINDIVMIFLFAPITALLLGIANIVIPWNTLLLSVILYIVVPLLAGFLSRKYIIAKNYSLDKVINKLKPLSMIFLLITLSLLFGFQANTILNQPFIILLIAIPLIIQSYGIFAIAYGASIALKLPHNIAAPAALIGTSNFFELAVAVSISLFGLNSGAVIATVVGVLVEVPVMLSLVKFANNTTGWFKMKNI